MKTVGIILAVMGVLSLISSLMQAGYVDEQIVASSTRGAFLFIGIGAFLIYRANKKSEEEEKRNKWNK